MKVIKTLVVLLLVATVFGSGDFTGQASAASKFKDISDSVHIKQINLIAEAGITKGCNPPANTLYCPTNPVTRGEMAAFVRRASFPLRTDLSPQFPDISDSVFINDINTLAVRGVVDGIGITNNFRPTWPLSRVVMARWMYRAGWCGNQIANVEVFDDVLLDDPVIGPDVPYVWACWKEGVARGHEGSYFPHEAVKREEMASFIVRGVGLK